MFDLATRRKINKGFGDGLSQAVEIAVTPLIMGLFGALIDGWLGTRPAFTLGLAVFGVCGMFAKLWIGYDRQMKVEEAKMPRASQ